MSVVCIRFVSGCSGGRFRIHFTADTFRCYWRGLAALTVCASRPAMLRRISSNWHGCPTALVDSVTGSVDALPGLTSPRRLRHRLSLPWNARMRENEFRRIYMTALLFLLCIPIFIIIFVYILICKFLHIPNIVRIVLAIFLLIAFFLYT